MLNTIVKRNPAGVFELTNIRLGAFLLKFYQVIHGICMKLTEIDDFDGQYVVRVRCTCSFVLTVNGVAFDNIKYYAVYNLVGCDELVISMISVIVPRTDVMYGMLFDGAVLGSGAFGVVRECLDLGHHRLARKTIIKESARKKEIAMCNAITIHPNIVKFYYATFDYLVFELMEQTPLNEGHLRDAGYGLQHLASLGICHCDVKPDNIMVKGGVGKLCDLGLACYFGVSGMVGTARYMCPIMLTAGLVNEDTDKWSLMMSLNSLQGYNPYVGLVDNAAIVYSVVLQSRAINLDGTSPFVDWCRLVYASYNKITRTMVSIPWY
jgi:hypothetical protein